MAASSSKQLWEHLQERQEPFILNIYISERKIISNHQKAQSWCNLNKRKIHRRKILKSILYKLIHCQCRWQDFNCREVHKHDLISKSTRKLRPTGGTNRCSNMGSSVAYHDPSKCSNEGTPHYENQALHLARNSQYNKDSSFIEHEVATDLNRLGECKKDNKQLKPRSFLYKGPASSIVGLQFPADGEEEYASNSSTMLTKNAEEDSILSALQWEPPVKTLTEKQNQDVFMEANGIVGPGFPEHLKSERALQQTEKLLFDCASEAIEIHGRKKKYRKCTQGSLGLEELGKVVCETICSWGNQKPAQMINFDVSNVVEDWSDMQRVVNRKLRMEIGDIIMGEVIQELISLFF